MFKGGKKIISKKETRKTIAKKSVRKTRKTRKPIKKIAKKKSIKNSSRKTKKIIKKQRRKLTKKKTKSKKKISKKSIRKSTKKSKIKKKISKKSKPKKKLAKLQKGGAVNSNIPITIYQLFTDIDDTIHPAGNVFRRSVAGSDFGDKNKFYNCVKELHNQIERINTNAKDFYDIPQHINTSTVLVSAKPWCTEKNKKHTKDALNIKNIDCLPGAYGASLNSTFWGTTAYNMNITRIKNLNPHSMDYEAMGQRKFNSIRDYVEVKKQLLRKNARSPFYNDEFYKRIFIGDNGQGDLLAARALLREDIIDIAFIRNIDTAKYSGKTSFYNNRRLFSFQYYREVLDILKHLYGFTDLDLDCDETEECVGKSYYDYYDNYFKIQTENEKNDGVWEETYGHIDDVDCFPCRMSDYDDINLSELSDEDLAKLSVDDLVD